MKNLLNPLSPDFAIRAESALRLGLACETETGFAHIDYAPYALQIYCVSPKGETYAFRFQSAEMAVACLASM